MKPRPTKDEIQEGIIENAPDIYEKRRAELLRSALGRDQIWSSIHEAVNRHGHKSDKGSWDTDALCDELYMMFHQIGTSIAAAKPSPWNEVPDVVLRSLKTYVKKCIQLRKGGSRKYWREDATLEAAPVETKLAKAKGISLEAVRLEMQQQEFPEGENLEMSAADKYAKRKVRAANNQVGKRRGRTNRR